MAEVQALKAHLALNVHNVERSIEFYKQMLVNKKTQAAALRAAQLTLSQSNRWRNPHYWAGFVLQGEWR